jgi:hypothetical protein
VIDAGAGREAVAREIWNVVGSRLNPVVAPLGNVRGQQVGA